MLLFFSQNLKKINLQPFLWTSFVNSSRLQSLATWRKKKSHKKPYLIQQDHLWQTSRIYWAVKLCTNHWHGPATPFGSSRSSALFETRGPLLVGKKSSRLAEWTPFSQTVNESLLVDLVPVSLLQSEQSGVCLSPSLREKPERFHVYCGKHHVEIWPFWAEGQGGTGKLSVCFHACRPKWLFIGRYWTLVVILWKI